MPRKGDVWLVNLEPTIGDEIRKVRPAVVMSRDALGILALRVVVPLTNWHDRYRACDWLVRIDPTADNGLAKASAADTFQARSISIRRLTTRLGRLTDTDVERVAAGLRVVLDL
jgi:mRNA interferase MazF